MPCRCLTACYTRRDRATAISHPTSSLPTTVLPVLLSFSLHHYIIVEIHDRYPFGRCTDVLNINILVYTFCCFFLCPVTYHGDGGTDRREFLHDILVSDRFPPFWTLCPQWGLCPRGNPKSEILGLNLGHLTANISKMISRSVTYQLELNVSSTRAS